MDRIRAAHSLLTPRGIRQLRDGLGLTIAQFSELCYGTPKGIVEGWEKGRYLQNRDADALMRSLSDRATLERRAAKAGVTLPVLDAVGVPAHSAGLVTTAANGSFATMPASLPTAGS